MKSCSNKKLKGIFTTDFGGEQFSKNSAKLCHFPSLSNRRICARARMVNEAKGRFFRRKDDKYLIYVPKHLAEDSMFPFSVNTSVSVKIGFKVGDKKLTIEKWEEKTDA